MTATSDHEEVIFPTTTSCELSELLRLCSGPVIPFSTWWAGFTPCTFTKVAEAAFAEVYRMTRSPSAPLERERHPTIIKMVPLRPTSGAVQLDLQTQSASVHGQQLMSEVHSIIKEVKILQVMATIEGFAKFRSARVVRGRPTTAFIKAYRVWDLEQQKSFKQSSSFPDPGQEDSYASNQLWAVLEMEDAGGNLEDAIHDGKCDSIWSVWDVFWQICRSLAKAERANAFEHRDLHPGNVCVKPCTPHTDPTRKLGFSPFRTTIIDYGLSRCTLEDGEVIAQNLSKVTGLFEGDGTEIYQYDIYRYMRDEILGDVTDNVLAEIHESTNAAWAKYQPRSNLLWLHLILTILLARPLLDVPPSGVTHELVWKEKADYLWRAMGYVHESLQPGERSDLRSATDLIEKAVTKHWLDPIDVYDIF